MKAKHDLYDVVWKGKKITVNAVVSGNQVSLASYCPHGDRDYKTDPGETREIDGKPAQVAFESWPPEDVKRLAAAVLRKHRRLHES